MTNTNHRAGLFPALLKHWRGKRGLSQLDLALAANVSSRHVSFLETGRSTPSAEMIVRLASTLDVPLRHINTMLQAAGHEPMYPEYNPKEALPREVTTALQLMKDHHEPFPLVAVNRTYDVVDLNNGAIAVFRSTIGNLEQHSAAGLNLMRLTFDPEGAQKALANFEEVGRWLLWRVQREVLANPDDGPLLDLLHEVLSMPTIAEDWRTADLAVPSSPTMIVHLKTDALDLKFVTMVTVFQAPQTVVLDELKIELWFPSDPATAEACHQLAGT